MLFSTKVISCAPAGSAASWVVEELAASLEELVTSAMFWGSLEELHALSSETASAPASAALMAFFFMFSSLVSFGWFADYVLRRASPAGQPK